MTSSTLIIIVAVGISGFLLFSKKLNKSSEWKAMLTPLASIMGSGFLVSAPLLGGTVGVYASFCMMGLLVVAYGVGSAIRYNISHFEKVEHEKGHAQSIAFLSRIILAAAYFISVTYYLQLLAAFLLKSLEISENHYSNYISSILLLIIAGTGIWKGLQILEKIEKYAVSLNLGMIGALLVSLLFFNLDLIYRDQWAIPNISSIIDLSDVRVLLGLLIVVQGFETSRYLGDEHSAEERITTMKKAQILSSMIYILFLSLATILFHENMEADVTAIIEMTKAVALILPILLAVAAIGSQFSAAVADTAGAGGLVSEITNRRLPTRYSYFMILVITLILTWETNVNQIIAYASRAFALFYFLQCCVAWIMAKKQNSQKDKINFLMLAIICFTIFLFGTPAE